MLAPGTTLQQRYVIKHHVASIAYAPDGRTLVSGSWDYSITICDVETRSARQRLEVHTNIVHGVTFAPDGHTFATGSRDQTVRLWRIEDGTELNKLWTGYYVVPIDLAPDSKLLVSGGGSAVISLWDLETGTEVGQPRH